MKPTVFSKSFFTVLSVLSVLLGFALLCGAAIGILHSMEVISFFSEQEGVIVSHGTGEAEEDLPVHTKMPQTGMVKADSDFSEELLLEMPFTDAYYMKFTVRTDGVNFSSDAGVYELWYHNGKFRFHRYHLADNEVEAIVICDGMRVQMTDFEKASVTYATADEAHSVFALTPLPHFETLFSESYQIVSYEETDATVAFSCRYGTESATDDIRIAKETGLLSSYSRTEGDTVLFSVDVVSAYAEEHMIDDMFFFS